MKLEIVQRSSELAQAARLGSRCYVADGQLKSRREHAPGPAGSPQDPQAPLMAEELAALLFDTENVEICGASFLLWHFGHSTFSAPNTKASNP
jgi:hypothetical protein